MTAAPVPVEPDDYHVRVARGFDALARGYDAAYPGSLSLERMRSAASETLRHLARPGQTWLELGCGTGRDAVDLARRGVRVLAADPSAGMIGRLRERLARENPSGAVTPLRMGTPDLEDLLPEWEGRIDGAALLFGALSYDPAPEKIPPRLWRLLKPGAPVVAAARNRFCPWEILHYLLRRPSPALAFRRFRPGGALTTLGPETVPMFVQSPGGLARLFRPWFRAGPAEGLCVLLPPYMQSGVSRRWPRLELWLARLEPALARWPLLRAMGDHFLMVLRREDIHAELP